ncbi:hypothetical protein LROSL1_0911 [Furfurilactobacillus rossiae]|uniref:glycosyltransferase family 39 protein n=1 Tax=Furfurilactobacillus rossiae TaxID=231049 RepID=UPI0015BF29E8|nr:glycosyltransferase family 39 protein [Furfurilactobacillus rossiae]MCF6165370.1 glycosyltransferase family 39 protein [Furfurilactobacillus rossiae]QLE63730.1 hypothetical protein LROSL1_0911 [Furfurilactobacillus rossiae]
MVLAKIKELIFGLLGFFGVLGFISSVFFIPTKGTFQFNTNWFSPFFLIISAFAFSLFLWLRSRESTVNSDAKVKQKSRFLFLGILILQILVVFMFKIPVGSDDLRVKTQAYALMNNNLIPWTDYFTKFPNNVNTSIVYSWILKGLSILFPGKLDVAVPILLILLLDGALFLLLTVIEKKKGVKSGLIFLMISFPLLPLYMMMLSFYTDGLVVSFAIYAIFFFHKYTDFSEENLRWFFFAIACIFLAIGFFIKPNIVLMLIALVVASLLSFRRGDLTKGNLQEALIRILIIAAVVFVEVVSSASIQKSYRFTKNPEVQQSSIEFVLMGIKPGTDGQLDANDMGDAAQFTNIKSLAKRQKAEEKVISERIDQMGPTGLIEHFWRKFNFVFGRGTMDADSSGLQATHPWVQSRLSVFMFLWDNVTQVSYIIVMLGLAIFGLTEIKRKSSFVNLFVSLSCLGVILFHTFIWEAESRYAFIVLPFMLFLSAQGLARLFELLDDHASGISFGVRRNICGTLLVALGIVAIATSYPLLSIQYSSKIHAAQEPGLTFNQPTPFEIKAHGKAYQTFKASRDFNQVSLYAQELLTEGVSTSIIDLSSQRTIHADNKNISNDGWRNFLSIPIQGHAGKYSIRINNNTNRALKIFSVNYSPDYPLSSGSLKGSNQKGYYLAFDAGTNTGQKSLLKPYQLLLLTLLVLAYCWLAISRVRKME